MSRPKFPERMISYPAAPILATLKMDPDRFSSGTFRMKIADCVVPIEDADTGETIGHVAGVMGGGVEVKIGSRCWFIDPLRLFDAVYAADARYLEDQEEREVSMEEMGFTKETR